MKHKKILDIVAILCCLKLVSSASRLQEKYSWNALDYDFPDELTKQQYLLSKKFIPENNLPVGIEKWGNKLFVSVPRWKDGIPSTLNYIPLDQNLGNSPPLTPYPSLLENELGNCQYGLNTVYRLKADKCDRLWVLDTGTFGIENTTTNLCPYTVNVYDLKTDTRIRRYEFRPEDTNADTFIANTAIDIGKSCDDTFAYFSDELGYGLIAYSWELNKSWRFSHSFFLPDPLKGDFNIGGLNFQWSKEGIFGIALSPPREDGFRDLYFSPLASNREFAVSTKILRDESNVDKSFHDFKYLDERAPDSHTTAQVIDDNGIMLFNLIDQNAVGCWNSELPYKPENHAVVDRDDIGLIFPSDVKIDNDFNVWVISDRMPVFLETELDYNDINFRIYTASLRELINGTVCEQIIKPVEEEEVTIPTLADLSNRYEPEYLTKPLSAGFTLNAIDTFDGTPKSIQAAPTEIITPIVTNRNPINKHPWDSQENHWRNHGGHFGPPHFYHHGHGRDNNRHWRKFHEPRNYFDGGYRWR